MFGIGKAKGNVKGQSKEKDDKSTSRNASRKRGQARAQEKLAKKILGKNTGRRVFGFPCSPDIHAQIKMLAGEVHAPMYALAEHCLQLSAGLIAKATENSEERDLLRKHLTGVHVAQRTIEKFNWYDEELAKELNIERLRRFEVERAVRQIVVDFARKGMKPRDMAWYIDYGFRCFVAVINGRPVPKDLPQEARFHRKPQQSDNQPTDEKEDEPNDDSSEQSG